VNRIAGQSLRFLVAGGIATITDAGLFAILSGEGFDPRAANMFSYPASAVLAFLLHRNWTFDVGDADVGMQALRFAGLVAGGLLVSTAIVWMLAPWIGSLPAKTAAIAGTLALNFTLSRWLVFTPIDRPNVADARRPDPIGG
jgi:putative flippase GtrA